MIVSPTNLTNLSLKAEIFVHTLEYSSVILPKG